MLRASGMALAAIAAVVLGRELGAAGYGTYAWAFAWVAALAVPAALGADQLLVRDAAVARDRGEWARLRSLLRSALGWSAAASLATVAVATVVLAAAGGGLGTRQTALLVALPILPLAALTSVAQGALLGLGRTGPALAPANAGRPALFLAFVAAVGLAGGLSATRAVALQLAATAIVAVVVLAIVWRAVRRASRPAERASPRTWLPTAVRMGAAGALLILDAQVGLLVLGAMGTASDAGVYAAALACMAPFALVATALRLPLGPAVARLGAAGERERMQRGLRTATRAVALVSALIAVVLAAFAGPVLGLFGNGFSGGVPTLRLLAIAYSVNAVFAFNGLVLIMNGEERAAMRAALGSLVLDVALCLVLVPPLGARGAAIAALVTIAARNVVNSSAAWRRLGVDTTVLGRSPSVTRR